MAIRALNHMFVLINMFKWLFCSMLTSLGSTGSFITLTFAFAFAFALGFGLTTGFTSSPKTASITVSSGDSSLTVCYISSRVCSSSDIFDLFICFNKMYYYI